MFPTVATLSEIAEHAGVGIGTVSRVFSGSPNVSDTMRTRVMASASALGYEAPSRKRSHQGSSEGYVGLLVTFFDEPSSLQRFSGLVPRLQSNDLHVVLYNIESPSQARAELMELPRKTNLEALIIVSLPLADSEALLEQLWSHATKEEFAFAHKWKRGDVVMWDNRCTMHYAVDDYGGERRRARRATIYAE